MRPPLTAPLLLVVLVTPVLLAGCTQEPDHQPVALLQVSERVGEMLYDWGDGNFSGLSLGEKRVKASFEVPEDITHLGVIFRGSYSSLHEERQASLRITADDNTVLLLDASPGEEDEHTVIRDVWQFRPAVPVAPGKHNITATGQGVQHLEFSMQSIPKGPSSINETFNVTDPDRPIRLQVFAHGWGGSPYVDLRSPDGTRVPIDLTQPHDQADLDLDPQEGMYRLDVDTTGWGGRFVFQATQ